MAFNDTLFQLGMDLTRSSTAQEEDNSCVELDSDTVDRTRDTASTTRTIHAGSTTLSIDLHGAKRLDDVKSIERSLKRAAESLNLKLKGVRFDRHVGGGVLVVATLAAGTISLQTCARSGHIAIDAFGCADLKPEMAVIALANAFEAREAVIQKARRSNAIALSTLRIAPNIARTTAKLRTEAKAA